MQSAFASALVAILLVQAGPLGSEPQPVDAPEPRPASDFDGGSDVARSAACLAEAVYFEARGQSPEAQEAVAHVVVNRSEHAEFPSDPCAVVADGCQFSYRCDGRPERMTDAKDAAEARRAAHAVLVQSAPDPTGGALFFHAARIDPGWDYLDRTTQVGPHVFYR
jgi:spore germination cell wall hydrolase CwlJ-like protein